MRQYHTPIHMGDFAEDEEGLLLPWKWNMMVDSLADEYYDEDHVATDNRNFAARLPGILYYGTEPITVPIGKWARGHTALKRVRTCFEEHHPGALAGIPIDWSCMASISKHQNRRWQRIDQAFKTCMGHVRIPALADDQGALQPIRCQLHFLWGGP